MKILITETQKTWLLRRLGEIDDYVDLSLRRVDPHDYTFHDYIEEIAWQVADEYGNLKKDDIETILDYVREKYWKIIELRYLKQND